MPTSGHKPLILRLLLLANSYGAQNGDVMAQAEVSKFDSSDLTLLILHK
jgi:hypothetical protein